MKGEVKEVNVCKWWQSHKWSKWEEFETEIVHDQHRDYKRHVLKRSCSRCGKFEFSSINQYNGEMT